MSTKVKNLKLGIQSGTTNSLYASWDFSKTVTVKQSGKMVTKTEKDTLDHYKVTWTYYTGDGVGFSGGSDDVKVANAIYSIPDNAIRVKVTVKPVSKTYGKKNNKTYWTGTAVSLEYKTSKNPPETPSSPSVTIDKYKLTASLTDITDKNTDIIKFELFKYNPSTKKEKSYKTANVDVVNQRASKIFSIEAGYKYRVRCQAINSLKGKNEKSDWSTFSEEVSSLPTQVSDVKCTVESKTSVELTWTGCSTAKSYEIQYTTKKEYFDKSSEVSSATSEKTTAYITGLAGGEKYFFRVRAIGEDGSESKWSPIVSTIMGSKPSAPTTWSSTTTAEVGDKVTLYWTHNSEDGSHQRSAMIFITPTDRSTIYIPLTYSDINEDEVEKVYSYVLDTSAYEEGTELEWYIQTAGISGEYSDESIKRTIKVYAPPTLSLQLGRDIIKWLWDTFNFESDSIYTADTAEILEYFPYDIIATAGPSTQTPVSYHVSITAEETYETEDNTGSTIRINAGDEVYSKVFNTSDNPLKVELTAGDITLENNQPYIVTVTVAMDSGLTAEASSSFTVVWSDDIYEPDAVITIDQDTLCAEIMPYCMDEEGNYVEDVVLHVYRREFDGELTEIETNIPNNGTTVTDEHPALDFARYRIVAQNINTNAIGFEDLPGEPIGEPSIVIQWNEEWIPFDYSEDADPEIPPWTGSMVKLPYNVDTSESYDLDVSHIKYIGRKNPVSYYGTQRGATASWSTEIVRTDNETLHALRRLAVYEGDVYVREPSGTGYWANIKVSLSTKHRGLTIPVSFEVTRVEGGK